MMRNLPQLAAVLLACAPAAAQDAVLHPGSAPVAAERIGRRVETFDYLVSEDGEWMRIGEMTLRTALATVEGREAVVRTETTWLEDKVAQVDSFALDRRTLAAIVLRSDGVEASRWLRFGDAGVRVVDDGDWGADTADLELPGPVFYAGSTDLLLAALPLGDGYAARLVVYDPDLGLDTIRIRVEAEERVPRAGGAGTPVWRVWVSGDATGGWYWMDRESRTLVQYQTGSGTVRIIRAAPGRGRTRTAR
jgi:hypothetical protein